MQVKLVIYFTLLLLVVSCSMGKSDEDILFGGKGFLDSYVGQIIPKWFKTAKRFQLEGEGEEESKHYFFDVNPDLNSRLLTLNTVITTPIGSEQLNQLDPVSGQVYFDQKLCQSKDIWGKYLQTLSGKLPVHLGVVPRVLDETGEPLKVLVFGNDEYIRQYWQRNYFDVRVVGGVIEKECYARVCRDNHGWKKRLVLVAVQKGDSSLKNIKTLGDIKDRYSWSMIRAYMENMQGVDKLNKDFFPAYKWEDELSPDLAFEVLKKNSVIFGPKKIKSIKASCYKLYDHWWDQINSDEEYIVKGKIEKRLVPFAKTFTDIYRKYADKFNTCSRYVVPSNIKESVSRHWFFSYLTIFHQLSFSGYEYSCERKAWVYNPILNNGKWATPIEKQLNNCSDNQLVNSFNTSILMLESMRTRRIRSFRYIDFDKGQFGTHRRMYSWVEDKGRVIRCNDEDDEVKDDLKRIFLKDVRWDNNWIPSLMEAPKLRGIIR